MCEFSSAQELMPLTPMLVKGQLHIPCSLIGRINTIKMSILPKQPTDGMQSLPKFVKIMTFSQQYKKVLKSIWNHKRLQIAKAILR